MEKWPFFDQSHGLTPLEKCQFFDFWTSCFFSLERVFFVLEYRKRHFPGLYCLQKKLEKWPFLDQIHRLTPLEKCQFFDVLKFFFLKPRKAISVLKYGKRHFPSLYCLKKQKVEKWPFFNQNHGLTRLEKSQCFDFKKFLFL